MNKRTFSIIEPWQKDAVIICGIIICAVIIFEIICPELYFEITVFVSVVAGLATGIVTTIFVLAIQKENKQNKLLKLYENIEGIYIRKDTGNDLMKKANYQNLIEGNKDLIISIDYLGGHKFKSIAQYWKTNLGFDTVESVFQFSDDNYTTGHGKYKYTDCHHSRLNIPNENHKDHMGSYILHREETSNEILVLYQHIWPREEPNDISTNRGWEIWTKSN